MTITSILHVYYLSLSAVTITTNKHNIVIKNSLDRQAFPMSTSACHLSAIIQTSATIDVATIAADVTPYRRPLKPATDAPPPQQPAPRSPEPNQLDRQRSGPACVLSSPHDGGGGGGGGGGGDATRRSVTPSKPALARGYSSVRRRQPDGILAVSYGYRTQHVPTKAQLTEPPPPPFCCPPYGAAAGRAAVSSLIDDRCLCVPCGTIITEYRADADGTDDDATTGMEPANSGILLRRHAGYRGTRGKQLRRVCVCRTTDGNRSANILGDR